MPTPLDIPNLRLRADPSRLHCWADSGYRSRFDYDTDEHILSEIFSESYFATAYHKMQPGDILYVTDAAKQRATLIVSDVDRTTHRVMLDLDTTHTQVPLTAESAGNDTGYAIRWRGGRGGKFCIVSAKGELIQSDIASKHEAERLLKNMTEAQGVKAA